MAIVVLMDNLGLCLSKQYSDKQNWNTSLFTCNDFYQTSNFCINKNPLQEIEFRTQGILICKSSSDL
jgi:hypothetical protein